MRIISPSMLSADFGNLERDTLMIQRSAAEWVHIDVMDGRFVPNISFGFPVLKAIARHTDKVLDVHLMILEPETYIERFVAAGADVVTFHLEATDKPRECVEMIHRMGARAAISIKPNTPVEALREYLPLLDMVLIMSVEPGFGGQKFIPESLIRIADLRAMAQQEGADILIQVDGGVVEGNAAELYAAGADVLVAGSAVFGADDPEAAIVKLLNV